MGHRHPTVFISYAHDNADFDAIDAFEAELLRAAHNKLSVYRDKDRLVVGARISKFQGILSTADAVIVLCTPQYLDRVNNRQGGAYREYALIIERLHRRVSPSQNPDHVHGVLPILFAGKEESAIPRELLEIMYENFLEFRTVPAPKAKRHVVSIKTKKAFQLKFKKLSDSINFSATANDPRYEAVRSDMMKRLLFEHKHEALYRVFSAKEDYNEILDRIFVKTRSYLSVQDQRALILVGRKGSGKSTITGHIQRTTHVQYRMRLHVNVDQFNLEAISGFIMGPKYASDISTVITPDLYFQLAWTNFTYVQIARSIVYTNLPPRQRDAVPTPVTQPTAPQEEVFDALGRLIVLIEGTLERVASPADAAWTDFVWVCQRILSVLENSIRTARSSEDSFYADVLRALRADTLPPRVLGRDIAAALRTSTVGRVLFTLDGFDTQFDNFRLNTLRGGFTPDQAQLRNSVEINWLRGLMHFVLDIQHGDQFLQYPIDFCLTLPKDRFLEAREAERDTYRYRTISSDIKWTGVELALLLFKRLQVIFDLPAWKSLKPIARFEEAMRKAYPEIPTKMVFELGRHHVDTSLFVYLLRHSFWRPRDMLFLLAEVVAASELLHKRKADVTVEIVRKAVAHATFGIVSSEFISEFKSMCVNIREVIGRFEKSENIITFEQLAGRIGGFDFIFSDPRYFATGDIRGKMKFLFEIGFLGVLPFDEGDEKHRAVFYFSDGDEVFESMGGEERQRRKYVIHPVFSEYLRLRTSEDHLVNYYSDEFLAENDTI